MKQAALKVMGEILEESIGLSFSTYPCASDCSGDSDSEEDDGGG